MCIRDRSGGKEVKARFWVVMRYQMLDAVEEEAVYTVSQPLESCTVWLQILPLRSSRDSTVHFIVPLMVMTVIGVKKRLTRVFLANGRDLE